MSFGFSVGDFLATAELVKSIVSSLRNASASSYQELVLELHGLQRALHEIEHLKCPPDQEGAVNSEKVAALMCQHPLKEFATEIKKYERLGPGCIREIIGTDKLKLWGRKVQWGLQADEKVKNLRAYIAAHVGSLNMRLITLGL
jgi:hypothetical protein